MPLLHFLFVQSGDTLAAAAAALGSLNKNVCGQWPMETDRVAEQSPFKALHFSLLKRFKLCASHLHTHTHTHTLTHTLTHIRTLILQANAHTHTRQEILLAFFRKAQSSFLLVFTNKVGRISYLFKSYFFQKQNETSSRAQTGRI